MCDIREEVVDDKVEPVTATDWTDVSITVTTKDDVLVEDPNAQNFSDYLKRLLES